MKDIKYVLNESSSNRRDILRREFTKFLNTIYDDDGLVIGDKTIAEIWDDGSIVFPKDFNEELAKFIVRCYIYKHNDWETKENDYYIYLGNPNKDGKEIKW